MTLLPETCPDNGHCDAGRRPAVLSLGPAILLLVLLALTADAASAALANRKVSGDGLAHIGATHFIMSPDGAWLVFLGYTDTSGTPTLFSAPSDGSQPPAALTLPLPTGMHIRDENITITPDSSHVLFIAPNGSYQDELYRAPIDGSSPPVVLNGPLVTNGVVIDFQLTADGSRAIYLADQDTEHASELYSVPVDGSAMAVKLNEPVVNGGDIFVFQISQDQSRVVYWGDQDTDDAPELYSVPVDGSSPPTRLNRSLVSGGSVQYGFAISPDSSRVVYRADQDTANVFELYSVRLDGLNSPTRLNGSLVSGGDVNQFTISPDSNRVIYSADQDTDTVVELYSAPLEGGAGAVKLNAPLPSGGQVFDQVISPDSTRVVYLAEQITDGVLELGSVPIEGNGPPVRLNGPLVSGGNVDIDFQISPDSSRVLYIADQQTDESFELYSVRLGGGGRVRLNAPLVLGGDVEDDFAISPDGSRVVFRADQDTNNDFELYSAPLAGGEPPVRLNGALAQNGDVEKLDFSADGQWVFYRADETTNDVTELYRAPADGSALPIRLNGPLVAGGNVDLYRPLIISPDGSFVAYLADQENDDLIELFVTFEEQPPALSFSTASAAAGEGAGSATATVQLSEPVGAATVQVDYAVTGGTASGGGVDFDLAGGRLLFAPGVVSQTITINVVDDGQVEADETVVISLSAPQNAALGAPDTFTLTILDDDNDDAVTGYHVFAPLVSRK